MGHSKSILREMFIAIHSNLRKQEKSQTNLMPKVTGKRTNKAQSQQKERNHKDQSRNKCNRDEENNRKDQ